MTLAAPAPTSEPAATPQRSRGARADIQALRAVAVALVVVYHLWPSRLSGGFVGVDVFFVVSGFLITSHLLSRPPRTGRDLASFWARRIRRLLPASLLVLGVSLVLTPVLLPDTQWEAAARQSGAASVYLVNWLLADSSVDYLAAQAAASPVQHFWSLAVEEQFYLGWPVLVLALTALAARIGRRGAASWPVIAAGLGTVVVASFAWSVHLTAADPARAYFVTPTRLWELGAGALLAVLVTRPGGLLRGLGAVPRAALAWAGLAAVLVAAVGYDDATPFPGWTAALPVLGTVLVLAADAGPQSWSPTGALGARPVQWLGDVSYSVYLWHWPLIVFFPAAAGTRSLAGGLAIMVATGLLAAATKVWVEDRFRRPRADGRLLPAYLFALVGALVAVLASAGLVAVVQERQDDARERLEQVLAGDDPCLGAGFLSPDRSCPAPTGAPVPAPALAAQDKSEAYADVSGGRDCWASAPRFPTVTCSFGAAGAGTEIALVGNSHAGHWLPALQQVAEARGWRIRTYLASQCALSEVPQALSTPEHTDACARWVERTTRRVAARAPDLVVVSNRISVAARGYSYEESPGPYGRGYERVLGRLAEAGLPVLAIHDTPAPGDGGVVDSVPDCVAEHPDDLDACSGPREDWEPTDPVVDAVAAVDDPRVQVLDLNDRVCGPERCEAVVGGVVVYFDGSHLTATYARTLSRFLAGPLLRGLKAG